MIPTLKSMIVTSTLGLCLLLTGCGYLIKVNQPHIQQGNLITQDQIAKLRTGMSKRQVTSILGAPVLTTLTISNTLNYVYTNQPSHQPMTKKQLTVFFRNGRMTRYLQN